MSEPARMHLPLVWGGDCGHLPFSSGNAAQARYILLYIFRMSRTMGPPEGAATESPGTPRNEAWNDQGLPRILEADSVQSHLNPVILYSAFSTCLIYQPPETALKRIVENVRFIRKSCGPEELTSRRD